MIKEAFMTNPLDSGDLSSIQAVGKDIKEFIEQIEKGNVPNPGKLLKIEKELKSLVKNKSIPEGVKTNLEAVLQNLHVQEEFGGPTDLESLYTAKTLLGQALQAAKLN